MNNKPIYYAESPFLGQESVFARHLRYGESSAVICSTVDELMLLDADIRETGSIYVVPAFDTLNELVPLDFEMITSLYDPVFLVTQYYNTSGAVGSLEEFIEKNIDLISNAQTRMWLVNTDPRHFRFGRETAPDAEKQTLQRNLYSQLALISSFPSDLRSHFKKAVDRLSQFRYVVTPNYQSHVLGEMNKYWEEGRNDPSPQDIFTKDEYSSAVQLIRSICAVDYELLSYFELQNRLRYNN